MIYNIVLKKNDLFLFFIGLQGPIGETGVAGLPGPMGVEGPMGEKGSQGIKGETGKFGQPGLMIIFRKYSNNIVIKN